MILDVEIASKGFNIDLLLIISSHIKLLNVMPACRHDSFALYVYETYCQYATKYNQMFQY